MLDPVTAGVFHEPYGAFRARPFHGRKTMIGSPLTAKDWNHELETTHGDRIVRMLMPYHEIPMLLDAPMPHLDKEVPAALLGLGLPAAPCRAVSREDFMRAVDALPEHARRGGGMGLVVGLSESLSQPTEPLLERNAERTPSFDAAANLLHASLLGTLTERMDRDFGRLSNTGVRLALRQSLSHAVAALADGRPDLALKSEPFVRMFRAGNWPLGIMKDGDFLVLVR